MFLTLCCARCCVAVAAAHLTPDEVVVRRQRGAARGSVGPRFGPVRPEEGKRGREIDGGVEGARSGRKLQRKRLIWRVKSGPTSICITTDGAFSSPGDFF